MRKYEKGELITSLDELMEQDFIFWCGKVYHKGWVQSWQIRMVNEQMKRGNIFKAKRKAVPVCSIYFLTDADFITQEVLDNAIKKHERTLKIWMDSVKGL